MRVVLSGYYGFDNAGDEALLTAITSTLKSYRESIEFTVLSGNPKRTEILHGLRAVSRVNPLVLLRELSRADLLISGGGSLLQDVTGPLSIPYYLGVTALARLLGTPVVFYAQGIGPVNKGFSKFLIKLVANRMNLITLRDEDSAQLLEAMGVHTPPVLITADPVFSITPTQQDIAEGADFLASLGLTSKTPIIGVSLRYWEGFSDEKLARMLDQLTDLGYSVLLLPMQHPEDLVYSRKVSSFMNKQPFITDKPLSCLELMGVIANLKVLVGMRLHSLIFSCCAGVPFEGISYDPKVESFLNIFGRSSLINRCDYEPQQVAETIHQTAVNNDDFLKVIQETAAKLKDKSDDTARLVLSVVDGTVDKDYIQERDKL